MTLTDIIYSTILVSIPEAIFMVYLVLLPMKRFDYLDKYNIKDSLKVILLKVAIPFSIITNFTLYGIGMNDYLRIFMNYILLALLIKLLLKETEPLKKIFSHSFIAFGITTVLEVLVSVMMFFMFNLERTPNNTDVILNVLLAIPIRILQFSVMYMIYIKMNSIKKINILEMWECNLYFRKFVYAHSTICMVVSIWIYSDFAILKFLEPLDYNVQLIIMTLIFILLTSFIFMPWIAIFMIYPSEKLRNKGKLNEKVKVVKSYENNR